MAEKPKPEDVFNLLVEVSSRLDVLDRLGQSAEKQEAYLKSIAASLSLLRSNVPAPAYRRSYSDFAQFEWASIGALKISPVEVEWNKHRFVKRSGDGKFGKAIWFSRCTSGEGDSDKEYERLITFKDYFKPDTPPTA